MVMPQETSLVAVFQATGFVLAALLASYFAWLNLENSRLKRRDELFDKRYQYYTAIRNYYLQNCDEWYYSSNEDIDELELGRPLEVVGFANEARFLFGDDIYEHIMSLPFRDPPYTDLLNKKRVTEEQKVLYDKALQKRKTWPTPDWFDQPFLRYMRLEA
jgi:hypothetical protein